jgi:hypothetical protein
MLFVGTVIFQTSNIYTNAVKGRIRSTDAGDDYVDWRIQRGEPSGGGGINAVVEDTSPQLGGTLDTNANWIDIDTAYGIRDENSNEQIVFTTVGSAVNYVNITNAITGTAGPIIQSAGETNVDLQIGGAGTGDLKLLSDINANSNTIIGLDASKTAAGIVELATTAELDTGTDSTRAIPVDQFVASKYNVEHLTFILVAPDTDVEVASTIFEWESDIAGTILQDDSDKHLLKATNATAGVTGTMIVDIHKNGTTIMDTNKLDIETTEKTTVSATTQPDLSVTTIAKGDIITFHVDAIHSGTAAKGLNVHISIRQ